MKKLIIEKTIFEVLFEKEICFSVNVSINTFKLKCTDVHSLDYFLIILKNDLKDIKNEFRRLKNELIKEFGEKECKNLYSILESKTLNFYENNDYKHILEYDLSSDEISEFKKHIDKFVKVQHNQFGRVYELKNNSFKNLHESLKSDVALN